MKIMKKVLIIFIFFLVTTGIFLINESLAIPTLSLEDFINEANSEMSDETVRVHIYRENGTKIVALNQESATSGNEEFSRALGVRFLRNETIRLYFAYKHSGLTRNNQRAEIRLNNLDAIPAGISLETSGFDDDKKIWSGIFRIKLTDPTILNLKIYHNGEGWFVSEYGVKVNIKVQVSDIEANGSGFEDVLTNTGSYTPQGSYEEKEILERKVANIVSAITNIGMVVSVLILTILGVKYMVAGIEEKADYKKDFLPYMIGCCVVFGISTVVKILQSFGVSII